MPISRQIVYFPKIPVHHWKGLKKWCYWWKNCWNIPSDCPDTADFRLKKGDFQRLISRRKRLTLTREPHQWKIWTFYFSCIPSLGGWRTNAWPRNPIWSEPSFAFPKKQWNAYFLNFFWILSESLFFGHSESYFSF